MHVLARKSIALLLSAVIATQPLLLQAAELSVDVNAAAANQPGIAKASNNVPVVNIAEPNEAGLSHNKYDAFNVGAEGLILNNTIEGISRSQLGGLVFPNRNLGSSGPANVILNEVTGTDRSLLEGMLEVHGPAVDVIIANPNGLTCNGCGFFNTPRVTLSTGTPEFGDDQSLKSLVVKGGDVTIGAKGADIGSANVFDIVSRKISVEGAISGAKSDGELNLIAGANRYHYGTGDVEALPSDGKEPEVAIDSSVLGGMYAGRIKVISSDKGSGVNMQGHMAANTGALSINADGKLTLRSAKVKGELTARSKSGSVRVEEAIFAEEPILLEGFASTEVAENAVVYGKGDVTIGGKTVAVGKDAIVAAGADIDGTLSQEGKLTIRADILRAGGAKVASGKLLSILAGEDDEWEERCL